MQNRWSLSRLLLLALAGGLVAAGALAGRGQVDQWTRERVRTGLHARAAALPEGRAAHFVRELAALDADAPAVIVPLLADSREPVAAAAEETLLHLIHEWHRLPPDQAGDRFAQLAHELAAAAPHLPETRRQAAHNLAARIVVAPVDPQRLLAAQVVADCEVVLRLPAPRWSADPHRTSVLVDRNPGPAARDDRTAFEGPGDDIRVAGRPGPAAIEQPVIPLVIPAADPTLSQPAPPPEPRTYGTPLEPERLIDASEERPIEPRQLRRPKAMKIEG